MKQLLILSFSFIIISCSAQKPVLPEVAIKKYMSPELLWKVQRVSPVSLSDDKEYLLYKVTTPIVEDNSFESKFYKIDLKGGQAIELENLEKYKNNDDISPDGKFKILAKSTKVHPVLGPDFYPEYNLSSAHIYMELDHRHWDKWNDGTYNHLYFGNSLEADSTFMDIMSNEPYNCPQKPFGGSHDYTWSPDSKSILYVSKKLAGTSSMLSTNTDLYKYDISTGKTSNLTQENKGYDDHPSYSSNGDLAWLSMATDGYEADKHDLKVMSVEGTVQNLTASWDETVLSYKWANDGKSVYFTAAVDGTQQIFEVNYPGKTKMAPVVRQLTNGIWNVNDIIGQVDDRLIVSRTSMNRAPEIYSYNLTSKEWIQITHVNDKLYSDVAETPSEKRYVTTTDGKKMLVWVIYPPDFDKNKKYPTLLYCQGGPQSPLTQFYSYRWNFHLMASQGYIVVAPNRRGMPGHGVEWNQQISGDYGGQNIQDYLSAIDDIAKEPYVDKDRLGAVGASYGGYSVFFLAGQHNKRFKSFISHCGIFNTQSMYGSTEEIFFVNHDLGGPYWENPENPSYTTFNPASHVNKWDTPILIIQGGKDYRVPKGQALEAFTAAQMKGLRSKLLYFPDENHWIMKPHNGLVWQKEFFTWLDETVKY